MAGMVIGWQARYFFASRKRSLSTFRDEPRWKRRASAQRHGGRRVHKSPMVARRNKNSLQPSPRRHKFDRISRTQMKFRSDKVLARVEKMDDLFAPVEELKQKL